MPNPYEDFFSNSKSNSDQDDGKEKVTNEEFVADEFSEAEFLEDQQEPLDEVLESIQLFKAKAEHFSKLLSESRAVDHRVVNNIARLFLVSEDKHAKESLTEEKDYHQSLTNKFTHILQPMKELAQIHLDTVTQFNRDIDKHYYSIEKTDHEVQSEKSNAIDGINLQRQILADAADDLQILEEALASTEKRIRKYIDVGGVNNVSASEVALLSANRLALTDGKTFQFNYAFFKINMIDKTAISLGVYLKETTNQYLGKLLTAFTSKS